MAATVRESVEPAPGSLITVSQVAKRLGMSARRAWELVAFGSIPAMRLGPDNKPGHFRVDPRDLDAWIEARKAQYARECSCE